MTLPALALFDSQRKLGVRSEKTGKPVLKLHWRNNAPPVVPQTADRSAGWQYILGANNRFGTCGPTAVGNLVGLTTGILGPTQLIVTDEMVFDLYRRSGNPYFDPNTGRGDGGVINTEMLQALYKGGIGGKKPVAYASLADMSDASLYAAIDLFGGVMMGCSLQIAQSSQTDAGLWEYRPSGEWGGHDVCMDRYDQHSGYVGLVTWQQQINCAASFRQHQADDYWVVLWAEHVSGNPLFDQLVDVQTLAADYLALTGRPWPVPLPPSPPPPPPPPPPAGGVLTIDLAARRVTLPTGWTAGG